MSATSFLMVMAMLALVLGAMGVAMRVLRRYAMNNASAKGSIKMEIIQRLSLGQRQGIAVVRVGTRVLAVSMGDGGVHQVAELSEDDVAFSHDAAKGLGSAPIHAIADGFRKLALVRGNGAPTQTSGTATPRDGKQGAKRIPYVAPIEDFQTVLNMTLRGAANA
ncbi:MAG: flagellar biosynthetic protein FliO [Gemmatimonadaceae bacterium]